jgi:pentatricopeptide repeat protein
VERKHSSSLLATSEGSSIPTADRSNEILNTVKEFQGIKRNVMNFLRDNDYQGAKEMIRGMTEYLQEANDVTDDERALLSEVVDETFQLFFSNAFSSPFRGRAAQRRVAIGSSTLQLQLSSHVLSSPFNQLPRRTLLSAVKALTGVNESKHNSDDGLTNADEAYRILQRLVTGVGVRNGTTNPARLYESDFNLVLNAYSSVGRMDMAHRIVALQERTAHAPSLSPVAYSILLKGYGRLRDFNNIQMLLNQAQGGGVEPDIIMLNSLIDAYVNCDELKRAEKVFKIMKNPEVAAELVPDHEDLLTNNGCPAPNIRTYNIIMKGFARAGMLDDAIRLADEMKDQNLRDHVTTNTMVQAAVKAGDFAYAEQVLEEHTERPDSRSSGRHKNAEAYTTLMDGYAKEGDIKKGVELLKIMKERSVEPNEFTYTCLIGALARSKKVEQAKRMMDYMDSAGLKVKRVTYNSLISGLVHRTKDMDGEEFDGYVDEAIGFLREMMKRGIRPNDVTVSVIVGAFGKCDQPRTTEAVSLIKKLCVDGVISRNNIKVATSFVQLYGVDQNLGCALDAFRGIKRPDVAAINSLLHACLRCNNEAVALKTFNYYFQEDSKRQSPDVTSYSTMITFFLKKNSSGGSKAARELYENMKYKRRIMPDTALVDM